MKLFKKLDQRGFEHVSVLAVFLVGFGIIGAYFLVKSHAATYNATTPSTDCQRYVLKSGDTGSCVKYAQEQLNRNGFSGTPVATDGKFGSAMLTAVKNHQTVRCLVPDGAIGSKTWGSLMDFSNTAPSCMFAGVASGRCIDVIGRGTANGTRVQLYDCLDGSNQRWTPHSDGTITVSNSGRCLDIVGRGTTNGSAIDIWDCNGGANQKWTIRSDGSLLNPVSGRCLDATGYGTANGTRLQLYDCLNGSNQKWSTWYHIGK